MEITLWHIWILVMHQDIANTLLCIERLLKSAIREIVTEEYWTQNVVGTHLKCIPKVLLMSKPYISFHDEIRKKYPRII